MNVCNSLMPILRIVIYLLKIFQWAIPIILIALVTFDFVKSITASDEKMMEKAKNVAVKRLIYAVIIFLVPVIIRFTFKILGNSLSTNNLGLDGPAAGIKCFNDAWDSL